MIFHIPGIVIHPARRTRVSTCKVELRSRFHGRHKTPRSRARARAAARNRVTRFRRGARYQAPVNQLQTGG